MKINVQQNLLLSAGGVARATGLLVAGLAVIAALASTLLWGNHEALGLYYLVLVSVGAAAMFYSYSAEGKQAVPLWWIFGAILLTAFGAYLRFRHLESLVPSQDEDINSGRLFFSHSTAQMAAWVQQPPFFYYLSLLGRKLFGTNLFGLRIFSTTLASLSVPLFALLLLRTCRSPAVALIGAAFFVGNPWLLAYAVEARPYTSGVFFLLLYLHASLDLETSSRRAWVGLCATNLFFFLSLSLQPALIAGTFSLLWAIMKGKERWKPALSLLLVALLFLPFQLTIFAMRDEYLHAFPQWKSLWSLLPRFVEVGRSVLEYPWLMPLAVLPFPFFFLRRSGSRFPFLIAAVALIFPILLLLVFGTVVNFIFYQRYLLLGVPLYLAALAYGVDGGLDFTRNHRMKAVALGCLLLPAAAYLARASAETFKEQDMGIPALYAWLEKEGQAGDWAFMFALSSGRTYSLTGFTMREYYGSQARGMRFVGEWQAIERATTQAQIMIEALEEKGAEPQNIFLVARKEQTEKSLAEVRYKRSRPSFAEIKNSGNPWKLEVVRLRVSRGARLTLKNFLLDIEESEIPETMKWRAREALVGIAVLEKNCSRAVALLRKLNPGTRWSAYEQSYRRVADHCGTPKS
ncbi:MAG: glycosyltransferase family 39 protein [Bacteriovoracia bacterium]